MRGVACESIFFAASVAFAIPVRVMFVGGSALRLAVGGLAFGVLPGILCKVVAGVAEAAYEKEKLGGAGDGGDVAVLRRASGAAGAGADAAAPTPRRKPRSASSW